MEKNALKSWKEDKNLQRFMNEDGAEIITVEEQEAEKLFNSEEK